MQCSAVQGMDIITSHCHHLLHMLAVDVQQELEESYPPELSRTPLRMTMFQRPNARARCEAQKLMVQKYAHLTPMQRYEHALAHSQLLPRALRLADFLMLGSMLDLCSTAVEVCSAFSIDASPCMLQQTEALLVFNLAEDVDCIFARMHVLRKNISPLVNHEQPSFRETEYVLMWCAACLTWFQEQNF
jgi:hypothetical protein